MAGTVRDRISRDMWRVVSDLADFRHGGAASQSKPIAAGGCCTTGSRVAGSTLSDALDLLDRTVLDAGGLRRPGDGQRDARRRLAVSRSGPQARTVAAHGEPACETRWSSPSRPEAPLLEALLEIADSSMTYRRRYQGSLQTAAVLDLLLADESNPRSLAFQLAAVADDVEHLPASR